MEDNYPEIALKQPKADPRTVLLHKRNFMESSSDHIQDFYRNPIDNTTIANCDKSKNLCKYSATAPLTNSITNNTKTPSVSKISSKSVSASESASSPLKLRASTASTSSSSSSSSSSSARLLLANFSKSCHFNPTFIYNHLHKTQKTELFFFLVFISCAIFLQTTQALPVRHITTPGRKLILHTNVYREHYHQKLLEEQRQNIQRQQLIQLQLEEQQRLQQQLQQQQQRQQRQQLEWQQQLQWQRQQDQQQETLPQSSTIYQQLQLQKNHIIPKSQILRRHLQPLPRHHHHLHQRAAPVALPQHYLQQYKMSYCNGNKIYQNLYHQMNASMLYIKQLCANYLRDRGNETFDDMSETWKLISLETRNPNRKQVSIENELHKKIHDFYLNLHTFDQLIDYASQDTNDNKTKIEHGEEISIDKIIKFLQLVKAEIKFNMKEAENLLEILEIEKPDLADNAVMFNSNIGRRVRDFLIIKNLIEEFEHALYLVQKYCENNESE